MARCFSCQVIDDRAVWPMVTAAAVGQKLKLVPDGLQLLDVLV